MTGAILSWANALLFFTVVLAYFVKSITGFGQTLVIGSLFSFVVPNTLTTPVDFLLCMPANAYIVFRERKSISLRAALPFALCSSLGLLPGIFLLRVGSEALLKAILGLVIVAMAIRIAAAKDDLRAKRSHPIAAASLGLTSGTLSGAFGVGVLAAIFFKKTSGDKHAFRANTNFTFLLEGAFKFVLYWVAGLLSKEVYLYTLALSPAAVIGMLLGSKLDKHIDERKMKISVIALLILSGTTLFVRNVVSII